MAYGTYARTVLSDQQRFVSLIGKYSDPKAAVIKELGKGIGNLSVITSTALDSALHHPHAPFIRYTIQAYAEHLRAIHQVYHCKGRLEEATASTESAINQFNRDIAELESDDFKALSSIITTLQSQLSTLSDEGQGLENNLDQLSNNVAEITDIITHQDAEWDTYREGYNQQLVELFDSTDFPINEIERKDLLSQDSWESMINHVEDLNIKLPDSIDIDQPNFGTYFELKSYLAAHSSLSRRMLPNSPEDVSTLLKTDSIINAANDKGTSMSNNNKATLEALHSKIQAAGPSVTQTKAIDQVSATTNVNLQSGTELVAEARASKGTEATGPAAGPSLDTPKAE